MDGMIPACGSEQNIASVFQRAADEHTVLRVGEVDSFPQARGQAEPRREVTLVYEMLTQMPVSSYNETKNFISFRKRAKR